MKTYRRSVRRETRFDVSSMCRMCIAQNVPADRLVDIYVDEPVTNVSVIQFCVGLECGEEDELPPKMCYDCYNTLTMFFAFKKMCIASDQYFKAFRDAPTIIHSPLPITVDVEPKEEIVDELSLAENNDMGLLETDCIHPGAPDEVLKRIIKCEEEYLLAHPNEASAYNSCCVIQSSTVEEDWEDEEEEGDRRETNEADLLSAASSDATQRNENTSTSTGPKDGTAGKPQVTDRAGPVLTGTSPLANETPLLKNGTSDGFAHQFPDVAVEQSPIVLEDTWTNSSEPSFLIKFDDNIEDKKYHCDLCSRAFLTPNSLKRHIKNHGSAQHKCPQCGKEFHQRSSMKRHLLLHSDRRFVCSDCSKVLLSREGLKCHIRTHHTERTGKDYYKYKCSNCSKTFAHSSGLSRHMAIHRGISYECEICSKKFNDSSQLKRHKFKNHHNYEASKNGETTDPPRPQRPSSETSPTAPLKVSPLVPVA